MPNVLFLTTIVDRPLADSRGAWGLSDLLGFR